MKAFESYLLTYIHTYIHTDRQIDRRPRNYIPRRIVGGQKFANGDIHEQETRNVLLNGGIQLLTSDDGLYVYIISSKFQFSSGSCAVSQSFHCFTNGRGSNRRKNDMSGVLNGM